MSIVNNGYHREAISKAVEQVDELRNLGQSITDFLYKENKQDNLRWKIHRELSDFYKVNIAWITTMEYTILTDEQDLKFIEQSCWCRRYEDKVKIGMWLQTMRLHCTDWPRRRMFEQMYTILMNRKYNTRYIWIHDDWVQMDEVRWNIQHKGDLDFLPLNLERVFFVNVSDLN